MAFTTGTATDYRDLLDKLRLYAVSQGWTAHEWAAGTVAGGGGRLIMEGPGAGAGRRVFVSIRTEADAVNALYSWRMRGAAGYTAGAPEGGHPGELQQAVYLNLWQNAITYWFYVNDRRIIVVAKTSTAYTSAYLGFFLPWATPEQYPFPLYIAGDYFTSITWSGTRSGRRMCVDPGGEISGNTINKSSAWSRDAGGVWTPVVNQEDTVSNDDGFAPLSAVAAMKIWPFGASFSGASTYETWQGSSATATNGALDAIVPTRQGERFVWPCMIVGNTEPSYGVLDGINCIPGAGLSTEQNVTASGKTFRIFQNIQRSSGNDFFAVEQI